MSGFCLLIRNELLPIAITPRGSSSVCARKKDRVRWQLAQDDHPRPSTTCQNGSTTRHYSDYIHILGLHSYRNNINITMAFSHDPTQDGLQAKYLRLQLANHLGHRAKVVEMLAISERNIYRLIRRYGRAEAA